MASANKRRKAAAPAQLAETSLSGAVHKSFFDSSSALLKQSAAAGAASAEPVVCLVAPAWLGHPVVRALEAVPQVRLREANVEHVSFLFPAKKTAFLLLGGGGGDAHGGDAQDAAMLNTLLRQDFFLSAKQQLRRASESFATVLVLVQGDAELFRLLSIDSLAHPTATVLYCHMPADAIAVALHRARLADVAARQSAASAALSGLAAHEPLQRRIARSLPGVPPNTNLLPDECWQLLSGRASLEVCTEHLGWSRETSQAILHALATDSKKEN
jgi:hypothetical protein